MVRKYYNNKKDVKIIFNSLSEVAKFNREAERTSFYGEFHISDEVSSNKDRFTGTHSYEEAEDLLLHGWDEMAKELTEKLGNIKANSNKYKNKTIYNVSGYQACVPRYLQGIPTNMISNKRIVTKQKVLNITKDFGYSRKVSSRTIKEESIKVLKLINQLELQGYRCNVDICFVNKHNRGNTYDCISIRIKNASQKMNIKKMAFPLVHPSMFRRIMFGLMERLPECENYGYGYGYCTKYDETKHLFKDEYYIPRIVEEKEITDIEKYKC